MLQALNLDQLHCLIDFQVDKGLRLAHHILLDVDNLSLNNGVYSLINLLFNHLLKLRGKNIFYFNLNQVIDFANNLQIDFLLDPLFGTVNYLLMYLLLYDW